MLAYTRVCLHSGVIIRVNTIDHLINYLLSSSNRNRRDTHTCCRRHRRIDAALRTQGDNSVVMNVTDVLSIELVTFNRCHTVDPEWTSLHMIAVKTACDETGHGSGRHYRSFWQRVHLRRTLQMHQLLYIVYFSCGGGSVSKGFNSTL